MSGRQYSKVSPALWKSARFAGLSDKAKVAYLYFCTNGHVTSAGCYELPDGYACTDLKWDPEVYREVRAEIIKAGMIDFDQAHSVVLVERWFKHNPPMNDKHSTGTSRCIADIESERLREKASAALADADNVRQVTQFAREAARSATAAASGLAGRDRNKGLLGTPLMQRAR